MRGNGWRCAALCGEKGGYTDFFAQPIAAFPFSPCPQGDALVTCYLRDVHSVLQLRSLSTGDLVRDIPLPGLGSVSSFKCKRKSSEAFFSYTSFTDPGSAFR